MLIYLYTFLEPLIPQYSIHITLYELRNEFRNPNRQTVPTTGSCILASGFFIINLRFCAHRRAGGSTKKWKICKIFLFLNGQALITKTQIFSTTNFVSQAQVGVIIGGGCYGTGNSELWLVLDF